MLASEKTAAILVLESQVEPLNVVELDFLLRCNKFEKLLAVLLRELDRHNRRVDQAHLLFLSQNVYVGLDEIMNRFHNILGRNRFSHPVDARRELHFDLTEVTLNDRLHFIFDGLEKLPIFGICCADLSLIESPIELSQVLLLHLLLLVIFFDIVL